MKRCNAISSINGNKCTRSPHPDNEIHWRSDNGGTITDEWDDYQTIREQTARIILEIADSLKNLKRSAERAEIHWLPKEPPATAHEAIFDEYDLLVDDQVIAKAKIPRTTVRK
jgi:hypothetical protein